MKCAFYYSHTVLRIFSLRKVKLHGPGHTMGGILGYNKMLFVSSQWF